MTEMSYMVRSNNVNKSLKVATVEKIETQIESFKQLCDDVSDRWASLKYKGDKPLTPAQQFAMTWAPDKSQSRSVADPRKSYNALIINVTTAFACVVAPIIAGPVGLLYSAAMGAAAILGNVVKSKIDASRENKKQDKLIEESNFSLMQDELVQVVGLGKQIAREVNERAAQSGELESTRTAKIAEVESTLRKFVKDAIGIESATVKVGRDPFLLPEGKRDPKALEILKESLDFVEAERLNRPIAPGGGSGEDLLGRSPVSPELGLPPVDIEGFDR